jgi:hypothetical protein
VVLVRCAKRLVDANDGDTITFAVSGIIALTSGELLVKKSISISGPGAASLTVGANTKPRFPYRLWEHRLDFGVNRRKRQCCLWEWRRNLE